MSVGLHTVRVASLCAGCGSLDLAVRIAEPGARTVVYLENEITACRVLAEGMEAGALDRGPIWTDLKSFDGRAWRGHIDMVIGGYPCQPFSLAGQRRGSDDPRHLWPHIKRILREVEPAVCFFENVDAHLRLGYEEVRGDLRELGYQVQEGIFTAEEVGAPHIRKRLFIMAYSGGHGRRQGAEVFRGGKHEPSVERGELAYARGHGLQWSEPAARETSSLRRRSPVEGCIVADSCGPRRPRRPRREMQRGDGVQEFEAAERVRGDDLGLFPPGPGDLDAWRAILAEHTDLSPSIKPQLRRLDDGIPPRVDELRLAGNGVCVLAAALAYRALRDSF